MQNINELARSSSAAAASTQRASASAALRAGEGIQVVDLSGQPARAQIVRQGYDVPAVAIHGGGPFAVAAAPAEPAPAPGAGPASVWVPATAAAHPATPARTGQVAARPDSRPREPHDDRPVRR